MPVFPYNLKMWLKHPALPIGEDRLSGMANMFDGNIMKFRIEEPVYTSVPETLIFGEIYSGEWFFSR